jgi:hypothetical protein
MTNKIHHKFTKPAIIRFIRIHKQARDTQRAGQRFCNMYIKADFYPEGLFNEENEKLALTKIRDWLVSNGFTTHLPEEI